MSPAGKPVRSINLDARRKARLAEVEQVPVTLKFGGKDWELPVELPAEFADRLQSGELRAAMVSLLADEAQVDAFFALKPSMDDMKDLADLVIEIYGVDEGK